MIINILAWLMLLVPMFVTDEVGVGLSKEGEYYVVCYRQFELPQDKPYIIGYGNIKIFTWLGFAWGNKVEITEEV